MSHWRAREPALTNAHTREYPLHGAPVSASRLPVCLLHRILLHARERVRNARRSLIARVCVYARARKALPNVRNWWNAVPGQPTNTVGTIAWNEGHLGALTVKPPLGRWRTHTKRRWFEPPFFPRVDFRLFGISIYIYIYYVLGYVFSNIKNFRRVDYTKFCRGKE